MSIMTELENLVVRLTGDGSSYQAMMKMAVDATNRTADTVAAASNQIRTLGTALQSFAQTAVSALTTFGLVSSLKGAFDRFSEVENQTIRLNSAMERNGENVEANTSRYKQFATWIDAVSTTSKRQTMSMLADARTQGLSSEMAMATVRNAIGFAATHGGTPEGRMRMAIGAAQGNIMARGIAKYRNMTDDQKKIEFKKDVDTGMANLPQLSQTASAQLTKLGQGLTELSQDVGGLVATAMNPFVRILREATRLFTELDPATKKTVAVVVALTMAFLAIGPVISTVLFVFRLLHIQQIIGIAAWLAWNAVVVVWNVAMLVVSATLGVLNILIMGNVAAWLAAKFVVVTMSATLITCAGVVAVVKAVLSALVTAAIALESAFTLTNIAIVAFNALALAVAGGAIYVGFLAIRAAVIAVYEGVQMVWESLSTSGNVQSQLERVTEIFGEWWDVLKEVFKVAQYNLPLAWELLQAEARLAVMQVKLLFDPLWSFLREGFGVTWEIIGNKFSHEFSKSINKSLLAVQASMFELSGTLGVFAMSWSQTLFGSLHDKNKNLDKSYEESNVEMREKLKGVAERFNIPEESPEMKVQRAVVKEIMGRTGIAIKEGEKLASGIGKSMKEAFKSSKIDAVEFGSAAALTHLQDYAEKVARLRDAEGNVIGIGVPGASPSGGVVVSSSGAADGKAIADQATEHRKEMVNRLREISANTEQLVRQGGGVVIKPAALGG